MKYIVTTEQGAFVIEGVNSAKEAEIVFKRYHTGINKFDVHGVLGYINKDFSCAAGTVHKGARGTMNREVWSLSYICAVCEGVQGVNLTGHEHVESEITHICSYCQSVNLVKIGD